MKYPCVIEEQGSVYGVIFPDLPGCYPSGESLEGVLEDAREAASLWMESMRDLGREIPRPSTLESIRENPEYRGRLVRVVDVEFPEGACQEAAA